MSHVADQPRISTPTGRLSQQSQPSAGTSVSFVGGYLSPVGRATADSLDPTAAADNAGALQPSTSADDLPVYQRIVAPVVPLPRIAGKAHHRPVQHWEGVVETIDENSFVARLYDRRHPGRPEEAEVPLSDVADSDLDLVTGGAVFYWTIGYLITPGGQRTRTSTIRFRRLPVWTEQDLQEANARAAETKRLFDWT